MPNLNYLLDKIESNFHPRSIFLYGSRARNDYKKSSDYEIGVLMNQNRYITENRLKNIIKPPPHVRIYPYIFEEFIKGDIDIPFQSNIFLREITLTGKTLRGEDIIGKITPPPIRVVDLLTDLKFSLARGSDAIVSYRNGDRRTASMLFYKSCLFGARDLIIFCLRKFPISYTHIYKLSKKICPPKYKNLVYSAYKVRGGGIVGRDELFRNIEYLNRFIERKFKTYYRRRGDKILLD